MEEEVDNKSNKEELDENQHQYLPLHEDKLKDNEDIEDQHNEEDLDKKERNDEEEGNVIENKERKDSNNKDNVIEGSDKVEGEEDLVKGNEDERLKENDDIKNKDGEDVKEPLDDNSNPNIRERKNEDNRSNEGIGDKHYHNSNMPYLHYNYQTMEKTNDYSKGYEKLPYTYTYSLKNSTNYISSNDRYSSMNSNKDTFNASSSFPLNKDKNKDKDIEKDDLLVEKTKKILNENSSKVQSPIQPGLDEDITDHKRSFSSFNRNQVQPQRSYYLSSSNRINDDKEKEQDYYKRSLLQKYKMPSKVGDRTYSINSSTQGLSLYPTTRIQAIKDKYKHTPFKSPLFDSSSIGNNNQRVSYQYEPTPYSSLGSYISNRGYSNVYYSPYIQPRMNYYPTRCLQERFCCHCSRGLFS